MVINANKTLSKAKSLAKRGQVEEAMRLYKSVLEIYPQNRQAILEIRKLTDLPNGTSQKSASSKGQINTLVALYKQGNLKEVVELGSALAVEYPKILLVLNILGAANRGLRRFSESITNFQQAIELSPNHAEAYNNLGIVLADIDRWDEALVNYHKAIKFNPDFAEAHYNLGNVYKRVSRYDDSIASYVKATKLNPNFIDAHFNLGILFHELGRRDESVASYYNVIQLNSSHAEAHCNLGIVFNELGRSNEAVVSHQKALELNPNFAKAHNNLGIVLNGLGLHDEAITNYQRAITLDPNYANAYYNLGVVHNELDRQEEAIANYRKAIDLNPNHTEAYNNLVISLNKVRIEFIEYSESWAATFLGLLNLPSAVRPDKLAVQICQLLKLHPLLKEVLSVTLFSENKSSVRNFCSSLGNLPLLLKLIELTSIPDLEIEKFLQRLRYSLLARAVSNNEKDVLPLQTSLALHCFTNEYVYGESQDESDRIANLEDQLAQTINKESEINWCGIAALASYRPLHDYAWMHELDFPEAMSSVFRSQIHEVSVEALLKESVPRLKNVQDQVSILVREQYEANPYPRWIKTHLEFEPNPIEKIVRTAKLRLVNKELAFSSCPDILIAGCGTGQHSLITASKYLNSRILAIDFSLSSLAYAIRKTREMNIGNIDYLNADILDLGMMDRKFDIVESVGVLHHMANPMEGWKVITSCLKSGGLMRLGLYSEFARQPVVKARAAIRRLGFSDSREDILRFRQSVIDPKDDIYSSFSALTNWADFYSTSELRDLLFHVQEHRFTLPEIKGCLNKLNLSFAGFELASESIATAFVASNPNPDDYYCLDAWHEFELANPNTFVGMYQFWAQKHH